MVDRNSKMFYKNQPNYKEAYEPDFIEEAWVSQKGEILNIVKDPIGTYVEPMESVLVPLHMSYNLAKKKLLELGCVCLGKL